MTPFKPRDDAESLKLTDVAADDAKRRKAKRALTLALAFCVFFMLVEGIGGYLANSIAVMSDAAHVATDVAALAVSLYALHAGQKPRSEDFSYGWHRIEIVGALLSMVSIWFLTLVIVWESAHRLDGDDEVDGRLMFILGVCGLFVNISVAFILSRGNAHVMHAHSHGDDGVCPSSPDTPTTGHGHSHGKPKKGGFTALNDGDVEMPLTPGGHIMDDVHSHGKPKEDSHGHSHGKPKEDSHGHSHGKPKEASHGHSHGAPKEACGGHGHSHGSGKPAAPKKLGFTSARDGENINVKSAMIHAIGDCMQSTGVIIAAIIIWAGNVHKTGSPSASGTGYNLADPIASFMFAIVTLWTTMGLFKQLFHVLMESSHGTKQGKIRAELQTLVGPSNVHDLHVWKLTMDKHVCSVHLVSDEHKGTLHAAKLICERYGVAHATIQIDPVSAGATGCSSLICNHASPTGYV
ncbi:hypothetical protein DIPPA_22087 [Diplonema papillatum]|nr:hypothetical protein DIPPA_22087 [Diplonema papillatum]